MSLELVSLTGADDKVSPDALANISSRKSSLAEWAILYFPEKEGTPRNPSALWRDGFLSLGVEFTAAHLCGVQVFREILDEAKAPARIADLKRYRRIQLNINARRGGFTPAEVLAVYRTLHQAGLRLILQYHDASKAVIDGFLAELDEKAILHIDVLFDGSRGKGQRPSTWPAPLVIKNSPLFCGYAGGLGPDVLETDLPKIVTIAQSAGISPYWIDMETGIRTENEFDLTKVEQVLTICQRFYGE